MRKYGRACEKTGMVSAGECGGYTTRGRRLVKRRGKAAERKDKEKHLKIYGRVRERIGMTTYLHGSMDSAKKLKGTILGGGPGHDTRGKG